MISARLSAEVALFRRLIDRVIDGITTASRSYKLDELLEHLDFLILVIIIFGWRRGRRRNQR